MQKFDRKMIAEMIKLRGLGFHHDEIADGLGVTPGAVSYQLKRIKKLAIKDGVDQVYNYFTQPLKQG